MRDTDARTRALILLANTLTMLIAAAVVLVALYVLAAGQLLGLLPERRAAITQWLGNRLEMQVAIEHVATDMRGLTPVVQLRGVQMAVAGEAGEPALSAPLIELHLAPFRSLWARQPVLDLLRIDGIQLVVEQMPDGRFRIKGMPFRVNDPDAAEKLAQALRVLYAQRDIVVERARVQVESDRLPVSAVTGITLRMHNEGDRHAVAGAATVIGQGNLPLSFVLAFSGNPLLPADLVADVYLRVQPASLEGWLPRRDLGENLWIDSLAGGGEAWLKLARGQVGDVRGRLQVDSLALSLGDGSKVEGLLGLNSRFHWRAGDAVRWRDAWTLSLAQLSFRRQGKSWPESAAAVEFRRDADDNVSLRAMLSRGSVEMVAALGALLPPERAALTAQLTRLAPHGQLADMRVRWQQGAPAETAWAARFALAQAGWRADGAAPGLTGLSGRVEWLPDGGVADLQLKSAALQWPAQFSEALPLDEAQARLAWRRSAGGWELRSNRFTLRNADARASGLFTLALPADGASPRLSLLGLIEQGRAAATPRYLPAGTSPGVRDWLAAALRGGTLQRGSFLVEGPMRAEPALLAQRTFQMRYEGTGITLAFLPGWPELTGADADVFIEDGDVDARARQARLLGSALEAIRVGVSHDGERAQLDVRTRIEGDLADAFALFREPLRAAVPAELLRWDGSGRLAAEVRVSQPLGATDAARERVTVDGQVSGAQLTSRQRELTVDDVSGLVRFDSRDGFSARELRGSTLGTVLAGSARTQGEAGRQQTLVELRGRLRMQPVNAWLKVPALEVLRGDADAALTLRFGEESVMDVRSDLRGIACNAPAPLAKAAEAAVDTRLSWTLGTETPRMQLTYGRALSADVRIEGGTPVQGAISLGGARLPAVEGGRGLAIEGVTATLSIPEWLAFLRRMLPPAGGSTATAAAGSARDTPVARTVAAIASLGDTLERANLRVGRMDTGVLVLDDAALRVARQAQGLQLTLDSEQLAGTLQVPQGYRVGDDRLPELQVSRLLLPAAGDGGGAPAVTPLDIPSLRLALKNARIGGEDYGNWAMDIAARPDGLHFSNVTANWRAMDIYGEGAWLVDAGGQHSRFSGIATSKDIAAVSEAFGFQPNLSSTSAKFDFSLEWRGRPDDLDIQRIGGKVAMDLRNGRFVTASARSQALRALGVFNVGTWQRRMKLDFTDLYKRGVAFDTLTGDLVIDNGRLSTTNLVAKGPSAVFEVSGSTELATEALDTRVRVTLPVNSNLYVGCLAGLAACAGIVAAEQLWGDRLEKLTTLGYEVRGTWADPQVKQLEGGAPAAQKPQG